MGWTDLSHKIGGTGFHHQIGWTGQQAGHDNSLERYSVNKQEGQTIDHNGLGEVHSRMILHTHAELSSTNSERKIQRKAKTIENPDFADA